MKNGSTERKATVTVGLVVLLVGSAVAAQASGFGATVEMTQSSAAAVPFLASIAFAFARKRS